MDDTPTATPPKNRDTIRSHGPTANPLVSAVTKNMTAQLKSDIFRPITSVRRPPANAPATQPHTHALATAPWRKPERPNIFWICCSHPLMTAVS